MYTSKRHAAIVAVGALAMGFAHAGDKKTAPATPEPIVAGTAVDSAMKAYIDPETGLMTSRPVTEEQKRAAQNAMPTPDHSKIVEIQKADGSTEWQFNGQVQDALVATRGADGKLSIKCSEHGIVHDHEADAMNATKNTSMGGRDDR